ncbi:MAG: hypothetical protein VB050_16730 [Geobacteraceae bacterium]|nr:hypothetical protein [Geobacteraceae bacterium]
MKTYQDYQMTTAIRRQSLRVAADAFMSRGTHVVMIKAKSNDPLPGPPLLDPTALDKILVENPYSNAGVIVGRENNLIAIRLERESDYDPDPIELLSELENDLGRLPSTMTIQYPNGALYKLYEYPPKEVEKRTLGVGIKLLNSNVYGTSGIVLLDQSELQEGTIKELSNSTKIAKLPDKWINHICGTSHIELHPENMTNIEQEDVKQVLQSEERSGCNASEDIELLSCSVMTPLPENESTLESEEAHQVTTEEYLQLFIAKLVIDGLNPIQVVEKANSLCLEHNLKPGQHEIFMMVYAEFCKTKRYCGAASNNDSLLRFLVDVELEVFRDHLKELCCKIIPTGEIVLMSTKSGSNISKYLTYRIYQLTNALPKESEIKTVMKIIESVGLFESNQIQMFNRVGKIGDAIYYDLGIQNAVKVTNHGWNVVDVPPIFRRYANHKTQTIPSQGGKIDKFFEYVNHDPKDRLLLSVYIISSFIPEIAHPVLYVYGAHGGAKSSMSSKIKTVIDPGTIDRLILNNKKDEVVRNLKQHYVSNYDNISFISNEISDVFCIASTGGGMDTRKKYTDEESHILSFKHCVILNGIKMSIKKPDLLDRSILIKLARVRAKDEIDINEGFNEALPEILGGVFDTLAKALCLYPSVKIDDLPRMASFAKWGYAIAEALGGQGKQFLKDYKNNIAEQNDIIAAGNTLAYAVLAFMDNKTEVISTIGKAYEDLSRSVKVDKRDRTFPPRSRDLRPYLEELGPVLDSFGIRFEFGKIKTNHGWTVKFINAKVASQKQDPDTLASSHNFSNDISK